MHLPAEPVARNANVIATAAPRGNRRSPPQLAQHAVVLHGSNQRLKTLPDRYRTSMCRHMARRGRCPAGARCHFAHSEAELRTVAQNRAEGLASRPVPRHQLSPKSDTPPDQASPTELPEADVASNGDGDAGGIADVTADLPAAAARFVQDVAAAVPAYQHSPYAAQPLAPGTRASRLGNVSPSLGHSSTTQSHSHASAGADHARAQTRAAVVRSHP